MSVHKHLDYEYLCRFHSDASMVEHTSFGWYANIVHASRCCLFFDCMTVVMCFNTVCQSIRHVKLYFQHRMSHFIPDCCHRCLDAWGTSASSPFVRTLSFRSAATSSLWRVLMIGASQVKSLPFQHRKSHCIPDCCYGCLDAWGMSASSPFFRTLPLGSASFDILSVVFAFRDFCQHQLDHLQSASASFRSAIQSQCIFLASVWSLLHADVVFWSLSRKFLSFWCFAYFVLRQMKYCVSFRFDCRFGFPVVDYL